MPKRSLVIAVVLTAVVAAAMWVGQERRQQADEDRITTARIQETARADSAEVDCAHFSSKDRGIDSMDGSAAEAVLQKVIDSEGRRLGMEEVCPQVVDAFEKKIAAYQAELSKYDTLGPAPSVDPAEVAYLSMLSAWGEWPAGQRAQVCKGYLTLGDEAVDAYMTGAGPDFVGQRAVVEEFFATRC